MAGDVTESPTATLSLPNGPGRDDEHTLELYGRSLSPDDQRLLRALADQLGLAIENQILESEAAEAAALADVDVVRTALLRAVSHDLRTPLASIKAMISGLRDPTVAWTPDETAEALLTVDEETDRLNVLVSNLLDASRLQIGALAVDIRPAEVDEIVAAAMHSTGAPSSSVLVEVPDDLPAVSCDSTLLERSLANVIANALRFSPPDTPVRIEAAEVAHRVHLRVIDRGIGIKPADRSRVTLPFQRFDDTPDGNGVGLGLSIAEGFVDAMGGALTLDDTPGGGLTVTISLATDQRSTTA
jgi:two-component system sensor histidine kinase KdpD